MSFGENLQYLRKKQSMTQEQFAETLNVSRQSVSKWESDSSFPEMDKIKQICQMFSCSMDTIIDGNVELELDNDNEEYDIHMNKHAKAISIAVGMCIMSTIFAGLGEGIINETVGTAIFMMIILVAVMIFIVTGINHENFLENINTMNVSYTDKQIKDFNKKYPTRIAIGVGLIIFGVVLTIAVDGLNASKYKEIAEGIPILFFAGVGVPVLVYNGMIKSKFECEDFQTDNDTDSRGKAKDKKSEKEKKKDKWYSVIMIIATIIFFTVGYIFNLWEYSWIAFVVGGLLCGIVSVVMGED